MANTLIWRGDALGVAQVDLVTFTDIEGGDQFNLTINRKTISVTALATLSAEQELLDNVAGLLGTAINGSSIPEWDEITASLTKDANNVITGLTLTGPSDGKPFTVTGTTGDAGNLAVDVVVTVEGDAGTNEKQRVTIPGTATGGTFTLSFDGQGPTAAIAYNAPATGAGSVQTLLETLSNIASGDIAVTGSAGGPWTVEFLQAYANTDVALMTGNGSSITKGAGDYPVVVTTITAGDPGRNEMQRVWLPGGPTGGTFTLTWQAGTTGPINYNASAATVQTALETLAAITAGDVVVTVGTAGVWHVEFAATYRNTDVELIEGDGANLTGGLSVDVTETAKGVPSTNDIQRISSRQGEFSVLVTNPLTGVQRTIALAAFTLAAEVQARFVNGASWLTNDNIMVTAVPGTLESNPDLWVEFIGEFAGLDVALMTVQAIPGVPGSAVITTVQEGAVPATNETQQVRLDGGPTGGTFTLTFRAQTTAAIAYNVTAAALKTALELLSSIDTVTVTGNAGGPWSITFDGDEGEADLPLMTGSAASLTGGSVSAITIIQSAAETNEIQRVQLFGSPAGGTFTLTYDGATTGALTFDESAADVETALDGLAGIDDCSVTGPAGGPWTVEFEGTQTGTDASAISGDGTSLSGAAVLVEVMQAATDAVNEVETITLLGSPTGGTFQLTYVDQTTGAIVYDVTAESLRLALETLSNIAVGDVDVSGSAGGPWTVTFIGTLAGTDVTDLTGDATNLTATGTQAIVVTASVTGTGPYHWDEADNWHNPAVPGTAVAPAAGDTIWFQDSDVDCLYGLETNTGNTLAALRVMASYTGSIGLDSFDEYWEYRPLNLACGFTNVYIGEGEGSGSGRIRLDLEAVASTVDVFRTGTSPTNTPAFVYKGGAATTALRVFRGSVGVAKGLASDTANLETLTVGYITSQSSDAEVTIGTGCGTITTVNKSGGSLVVEDVPLATVIHDGGEMTIDGAAAVTTLRVNEGQVYYRCSGTITTLLVAQGGTIDFSQSHLARTVTTLTMYSGSTVLDKFNTVTWTNPVILDRCSLPEVTLDVGTHRTLAVAAGA